MKTIAGLSGDYARLDADLDEMVDDLDREQLPTDGQSALPHPAPVERARRRARRMKPAAALRAAAEAGNVASVTIDNVTFTIGEPGAATQTSNPWDEVLSRDTH